MSSGLLKKAPSIPMRTPRIISPKPLRRLDPKMRRPRRKPVTVAIGYVYDEGIVFCADTKVSTTIKTNESKLAFFCSSDGYCCMTFAMSSDDSIFLKAAVEACWDTGQEDGFLHCHDGSGQKHC